MNYICSTVRPDVGFAVHYLSRKLPKPTVEDMRRARRVLIFLRDTRTRSLVYPKIQLPANPRVTCYVDASWGNGEKKKTICGYVIQIENRVIAAATKQQHLVAQITTEAEYIGLAYALRKILWVQNMILEMGLTAQIPLV